MIGGSRQWWEGFCRSAGHDNFSQNSLLEWFSPMVLCYDQRESLKQVKQVMEFRLNSTRESRVFYWEDFKNRRMKTQSQESGNMRWIIKTCDIVLCLDANIDTIGKRKSLLLE